MTNEEVMSLIERSGNKRNGYWSLEDLKKLIALSIESDIALFTIDLKERAEADARDAARYRWLRRQPVSHGFGGNWKANEALDDHIDAALADKRADPIGDIESRGYEVMRRGNQAEQNSEPPGINARIQGKLT